MLNYREIYLFHYNKQNNICPACGRELDISGNKIDIQHRLHKEKWAIRCYPLFIHSVFNTCLMHNTCNCTTHRSYGNISTYRAERMESRMRKYPELAFRAIWPITYIRQGYNQEYRLFLQKYFNGN